MNVQNACKDSVDVQALKGVEMPDAVYVMNWAERLKQKWNDCKKLVPVEGYKLKDDIS